MREPPAGAQRQSVLPCTPSVWAQQDSYGPRGLSCPTGTVSLQSRTAPRQCWTENFDDFGLEVVFSDFGSAGPERVRNFLTWREALGAAELRP